MTTDTPATAGPSLGQRAARGARTVMVGQVSRMVLQLASVMILARLLSPEDYGLMAISMAVVALGEILRDFGLSTAAIRAPVLTDHQRDKLFWLNLAIGVGLAAICVAVSPVVANVFGHPELRLITTALAATFILNGAAAQFRADLNRRMKFGALMLTDVGGQLVGVVTAVVLAFAGAGYLALVIQQLVGGLVTLVAAAVFARWLPGRPRRGVDVRSMVRFGVGLVGSQIVGYLNSNVDTVVIGLRFSVADLGVYNRGYQLLMRPLNQLRAPTTTVALPVLRRLHDDTDRASAFLLRGQVALGYTLVAGMALGAGAAAPIIDIFLGTSWAAVAPIFALLSVAGAFQTISYVGSWVYLARGLTDKLFWYSIVSLAIKVVCVLVGSHWGIVGVAAGFALAPALSWPISIWWLSRLTVIPLAGLNYGAMRILGSAVLAGAATYGTVQLLSGYPSWLQLVAGCGSTAAVYGLLALCVRPVRKDLAATIDVARQAAVR